MFKCSKCILSFAYKHSLSKHFNIHDNIFYKCRICNLKFKYKTNLTRHEKHKHVIVNHSNVDENMQIENNEGINIFISKQT